MGDISIWLVDVNGVYTPIYNAWGAPPCGSLILWPSSGQEGAIWSYVYFYLYSLLDEEHFEATKSFPATG